VPTESVRRAAASVADREGLDPDWLNDAVKGFLPGPDPNAVRYFEAPGLLVDVASAEYLLAMKLFSSRVETDAEDIALLYREVGYHTVDEGLALVERSYPGRPIAAKVQFLLDTALRLARYFGTSERFWLNLQARYDLEVEKDRLGAALDGIRPLSAAS
jgi:hypothetical protein